MTFIERNEVRDEEVLRPRMRGAGTELAIAAVTISGPYNAKGRATPSRRRIFVCRPASAADEEPCARRILSTLAAPGLPPARHRRRRAEPAAVLHGGPGGRRVRSRHSARARAAAGQPAVPVPHRARPGQRRAWDVASGQRSRTGVAPVVLSLEQHSRRRAAGRWPARASCGSPACWNSRCGGCWPIRAPRRW